ncbi:hypothetical protein CAEBREN_09973 [Caenorhabditis brenneri]|uniref:BTB domain-containing protein n=1 Tax=Caenorhabditis brenneri TaxID=135651 RepID=G0NRQ7_CAEBE|nr:hypothetical protein CAEBREN_09973 [Caenorhabditis brenneri]
MSSVHTPGTCVELHDERDVVGSGPSIASIKFPEFHMFDTNWKLKLEAEWCQELNTHSISLKLRHRRRSTEYIWNLEAVIQIKVDEEWLKGETVIETQFSNRKREVKISNVRFTTDKWAESEITCHVNIVMQVLSMASPVFLRAFADAADNNKEYITLCNVTPKDFRRILNMIYSPHLPPKQWIKETDTKKQLEHIYHLLSIAKVLEISIAFEVADKWLVKHGQFDLGNSLLLAQTFGLRELMGSELSKIRSIRDVRKRRDSIDSLNFKTKAMILDHLLFSF